MQNDIPLRAMEYIYGNDEEKYLPLLVTSGLANYLHAHPRIRAFSHAQDVCNDDPSQTLTAVETARGVLLFEYSGYGKECCRAYMQHLANHFFTSDGQDHRYVHMYKLSRPEKEALQAFRETPNAFSLHTGFFLPEKARYLDASIVRRARMDRSHRIEPTFDAFRQFTSSYDLVTDIINTNILRLLSLKETGGIYGMELSTGYIPFMYKNSFGDLLDRIKEVPVENRTEQNRIKEAIAGKADHILKRDYEFFSREACQKETLPVMSIQTTKGAVYLPVTDEGAKYKRDYLQYLADEFFTPPVQALQKVREFYISSPGLEAEQYMRKHQDFFESSQSYTELEKIPLYPVLQSEMPIRGGHSIEPTYRAFHNFVRDYNLDISPVNRDVSNLLFIREYGLPADFRDNTEYEMFAHRDDFRGMEGEMARLQSSKGYSEKDFYTIQNRQQELADKLLRESYGISCPPLQLTGPVRRQRITVNTSVKATKRKPHL